jgi:hypothetical protein
LGFTLKKISMAILRMQTTVSPLSGASVVGGSALIAYNSDNIAWPTLASKTGTIASSTFSYLNQNGVIGQAQVKASVTGILAAVTASTLAG